MICISCRPDVLAIAQADIAEYEEMARGLVNRGRFPDLSDFVVASVTLDAQNRADPGAVYTSTDGRKFGVVGKTADAILRILDEKAST